MRAPASGSTRRALRALEEGLELAERIADERFVSRFLNTVAWLRIDCGDLDAGLDLGARALEMSRRSRHATGLERVAFIQSNHGVAHLARGDLRAAADALDEAHHIVQHPPVSRWMTWRYAMHCFATMGELALARGDLDAAVRLADQSLEIAVSSRSRKYESRVRRLTGEVATARKRWDDADAALRESLAIAEAIGEPRQTWMSSRGAGPFASRARAVRRRVPPLPRRPRSGRPDPVGSERTRPAPRTRDLARHPGDPRARRRPLTPARRGQA